MPSKPLDALALSRATGSTVVRATQWMPHLLAAMARFEVNTPLRQAAFLAQLGHESGGLTAVEENLNYSAEALQRVFKKYFPTPEIAAKYARQPQRIANRVYANRMGNGDEASGDGWRYRGRGPIQLTGKANYEAAGKAMGLDLVGNPLSVAEPRIGSLVAGWFWSTNNLNKFADKDDNKSVSKIINTGSTKAADSAVNGLPHRMALYEAGKSALA